MGDLSQAIGEGHYAKKQILCKDWLIAWSHRSRFQVGLELARRFKGKRVLDHGCGDGTFLAMLLSSESAPSRAVGSELHSSVVDDCVRRFGSQPGLDFVLTEELDRPEHSGAYDGVICMEVLEHVVDLERELDRFDRLLAPGGELIVSVPVETGLPLVIKQTVRRIAGWRGLGDYPGNTPYSAREMLVSVLAGSRQHIPRPVIRFDDGSESHDHKGFNWMRLRRMIGERFDLRQTLSSPVTWLPAHVGSQVWLVARKRI